MRNAKHHVKICVRTFIVNDANYSKRVIFVVCKNMRNILLNIVNITIKVATRRRYKRSISFMIR